MHGCSQVDKVTGKTCLIIFHACTLRVHGMSHNYARNVVTVIASMTPRSISTKCYIASCSLVTSESRLFCAIWTYPWNSDGLPIQPVLKLLCLRVLETPRHWYHFLILYEALLSYSLTVPHMCWSTILDHTNRTLSKHTRGIETVSWISKIAGILWYVLTNSIDSS